jgi:hypothetical protein
MRASCSSSRERAPTTRKIARVSETGLEGTVFQRLSIDAGCRCFLFGCSAIVESANLSSLEPVIPQYERSGIQVCRSSSGSISRANRQPPIAPRAARLMVPFGILTWGQLAHYTHSILVSKEEI